MSDIYDCFDDLKARKTENSDYFISENYAESKNICVIGPHGGGIELGVSELVKEIARDDFSWYLFEGIQRARNRDLHITSHRFDEPRALALVSRHQVAVAIHGEEDQDLEGTYLGGRNVEGAQLMGDLLRKNGFDVPKRTAFHLLGEERKNICNRCGSGRGIQLEITQAQRQQFFGNLKNRAGRKTRTHAFTKYVDAMRKALQQLNEKSERI
jgi:phage replication-related protein YjqB (UPF0714/DUF867 family)